MMELPLGEFLSLYDEFYVEEQRNRYKELINYAYLSRNIAILLGNKNAKIENFIADLEPRHIYDVFKDEKKVNEATKKWIEQLEAEGTPYEIVNGKVQIKCGEE